MYILRERERERERARARAREREARARERGAIYTELRTHTLDALGLSN
jgi:hypothetical protein